MKCDELVELSDGYYIKEDVDEAIAELKAELKKAKIALWVARAKRAEKEILLLGDVKRWLKVTELCAKKTEEYK